MEHRRRRSEAKRRNGAIAEVRNTRLALAGSRQKSKNIPIIF